MEQWGIPEKLEIKDPYTARAQRAGTATSADRLRALVGRVNLDLVREESLQSESRLDTLWKYNIPNPAGASLTQIKRDLASAWRLTLALQTNEAQSALDRIELQLDDIAPAAATRFRAATE